LELGKAETNCIVELGEGFSKLKCKYDHCFLNTPPSVNGQTYR